MSARFMKRAFVVSTLFAALTALRGEETHEGGGALLDTEKALAVAKAVEPSLVEVRYWLRVDKGQSPVLGASGQRCSSCGRYHAEYGGNLIEEERPLERAGFVLSPTRVVTADISMHPRFVDRIEVRRGEQTVTARPAALALKERAAFLDLEEPLRGARPIEFARDAGEARFAVSYAEGGGRWVAAVRQIAPGLSLAQAPDPLVFRPAPAQSLIADEAGRPVTICFAGELPLDGSWRAPPGEWRTIGAGEVEEKLSAVEGRAAAGLLRVQLSFRSPEAGQEERGYRFSMTDDDEDAAERNVPGLLFREDAVLVLANLKARITARLERIRLFQADGEATGAEFVATLSDYGAFVARPERPLSGALPLSDRTLFQLRREMLLLADFAVKGEQRVLYLSPARLTHLEKGRWDRVYPRLGSGRDCEGAFLFDLDGRLAALPAVLRERADAGRRYGRDEPALVPVAHLRPAFADAAAHSDPHNIPLSEEEENRLAWLGVEMQELDAELARISGVSDQTRDGSTGGIVTYVYDGSPASRVGLELGDIALRIHPEGYPRAIEIEVEDEGIFGGGFPWDQLGDLPEQYFDQVPSPWPSAANKLNLTLTELGFGKKFTLEIARDGALRSLPLEVEPMPAHFRSSPKRKSEALGLTVREMTYEVRRYFRKTPDDPGLIVAKIERGSKASVAGLKPFEIITHINDVPLATAADFEKATAPGGELRLSVRRMDQGRIVKIETPRAEESPGDDADGAAAEGATGADDAE